MKKLIVLIIILGLLIGGIYFWWENGISPVNSANNSLVTFEIMSGAGTRKIADDLEKAGLIRDPIVFFLLIKKTGVAGKIQAGQFSLSPSMSAEQILQKLQTGIDDIKITIPEGKRADEIADILKFNFPKYFESWRARLDAEEGFLFPDTYYFSKDSDIDLIITRMKDNFEKKFSGINGRNKGLLTRKEIVIIASLVEREARHDADRPLVASVILNRYKIGMKLDIDATVQYALGYQSSENDWWKKSLTRADLAIDSPYNTYTNPGIPPGPISNPGLESLAAVVDAPDTNYFYYVSDRDGVNHYAASLDEHNQNIKKFLQ